ncbi:hypothetical protein GIB67_041578 [Kingdonia uniflora]|uniref:RNase H type-1 domain-containing protein n=1 Tax=Kingdonia uniflora TaxID=39325 RepID=A0A7J7MQL6_9MAGN|nr:hypothetical protein GIB67_041578 [Kingdonia uniflora]
MWGGWRLCNNTISTDENAKKKGISMASRCWLCEAHEESVQHIFWNCKVSSELWQWSMNLFKINIQTLDFKNMIKAGDTKSFYIKDLWVSTVLGGTKLIWFARNRKIHDNGSIDIDKEKRKGLSNIQNAAFLSSDCMNNNQEDLSTIHGLRVPVHPRKVTLIKSCYWGLSSVGEVKINTDGASKGNPGKGGVGYFIRNCEGSARSAGAKGLGITTSFIADCQAIIQGVKGSASNGWLVASG